MNSHPIQRQRLREERDACAVVAFVDKRRHSTHTNIVRTIEAFQQMGHRSGDINGEGDGCDIMADIPREIWARWLAERGQRWLRLFEQDSRKFKWNFYLFPLPIIELLVGTLSSFLANLNRTSAFTTETSSFKRRLREWVLWDCSLGESPLEWAVCHHQTSLAYRANSQLIMADSH